MPCLPRMHADAHCGQPVDGRDPVIVIHRDPRIVAVIEIVVERVILNDQQLLLDPGQPIELAGEALYQQRTAQAPHHMLFGDTVGMVVVPIQAGRLVVGDFHLVVEALARRDLDMRVVGIALR